MNNKSHLLINEPALQVLPSLAKAIGLEEAIILQQLHYWLNNPKVEGREHDGRKWIYNSYQEWQENFPFWSIQQIQRIFLNLERGGVVLSEKLDAKKHDQTKFYTLDYDALCAMEHIKFDSSSVSNSSDVKKELTETTTENTSNVLTEKEKQQANEKMTYILENERKAQGKHEALLAFEKAMNTPHSWSWYPAKSSDEPAWAALREFVVKTYTADLQAFERYAEWRGDKFARGAMGNLAISREPARFEISYSDFLAHTSMYANNKPSLPIVSAKDEKEENYVPNPNRRRPLRSGN